MPKNRRETPENGRARKRTIWGRHQKQVAADEARGKAVGGSDGDSQHNDEDDGVKAKRGRRPRSRNRGGKTGAADKVGNAATGNKILGRSRQQRGQRGTATTAGDAAGGAAETRRKEPRKQKRRNEEVPGRGTHTPPSGRSIRWNHFSGGKKPRGGTAGGDRGINRNNFDVKRS
jgi:hypothetical protein